MAKGATLHIPGTTVCLQDLFVIIGIGHLFMHVSALGTEAHPVFQDWELPGSCT